MESVLAASMVPSSEKGVGAMTQSPFDASWIVVPCT
jgi:hypothetical protein